MKRLIALLLVLCCVLPLAACGEKPEDTAKPSETTAPDGEPQKPGETTSPDSETQKPGDDPLENLDFKGTELKIRVSVHENDEITFPSQDRYIKGLDEVGDDKVQKLVFNRNKKIQDKLHLHVIYSETNLPVDKVEEDVKKLVQSSAENCPDIYNNDVNGLSHAMLSNVLWNVVNPGEKDGKPVKSYFDFTKEYWNTAYMKGATLYEDKQYLLAGDGFLDLIRYAWVLYVNMDQFDENLTDMFGTSADFYEQVLAGDWDYDTLMGMMSIVFRDSGRDGATADDEMIGLVAPHLFPWVCTWTSGLDIVEWSKDGKPQIIENNSAMFDFSEKFTAMFNTQGLYAGKKVLDATQLFLKNTSVFALSVMGEMESEEVRGAEFRKGVLPIPKYDLELQPDYHTAVHNQCELAAILNNTNVFTEASAYMEMFMRDSVPVLREYYESALKYKYNDDKATRAMIDLIHDTVDSPFVVLITRLIGDKAPAPEGHTTGSGYMRIVRIISDNAKNQTHSFNSDYGKCFSAWSVALEEIVGLYEGLN